MIYTRVLAISALGLLLLPPPIEGQDLSRYRDLALGSTLHSVVTATGLKQTDVRVIHTRPAVLHELEWRPQRSLGGPITPDPVREVVFSFYNDHLFRIDVRYDGQRTLGLTDADLIDVLSEEYGFPVRLLGNQPRVAEMGENDADYAVAARWETPRSSVTLLRGTYPTPLRLVLLSKAEAGLARNATKEASRLDLQEAPQREAQRLKTEAEAERLAGEKARTANKAAFKP